MMHRFFCASFLATMLSSSAASQYFRVETPQIYSPGEKVVVNLSSYGIKGSIFFRAYRIEDPTTFFQQQSDPHNPKQLLNLREANTIDILRSSRDRLRKDQRRVFRENMSAKTRTTVKNTLGLKTFSVGARASRMLSPLKNYPLLSTWEVTEFARDRYSYRDVEVDLKEPGVYLVEAFNEKLMAHTVVVISRLGMVTKSSSRGTLVMVCNKITGEPVADVKLLMLQDRQEKARASTDKQGLARFELVDNSEVATLVLGQKDDDFVLSDPYYYGIGRTPQYVVHAYTDRPIYRPLQTVYFKSIVREKTEEGYAVFDNRQVEIKITDRQGNEIYRQRLTTNDNGAVSGNVTLGETPGLGTYRLATSVPGGITHYATFKVEEYKKPEFKVEVTTGKDQYSNGELITATIKADYYFGSPVANAQVDYYIFRGPVWRAWWYGTQYAWYYEDEAAGEGYGYRAELLESHTAYLDENGQFHLTYQTARAKEDYYYRIEARVVDASRRQIIGSRKVEVTRGMYMVSLHTDKYVYAPGQEATINVTTEDFKYRPVSATVRIEVHSRKWVSGKGWQDESTIHQEELVTGADGRAYSRFTPSGTGYYYITAVSTDARGNRIDASDYCWVSSGTGYYGYQSSGLEVIPDKDSYRTGETAHVLVISPVKNTWALITAEGPTLLDQQLVHIQGTSQLVDLKIEEKHQPNFAFAVAMLANNNFYNGSKNVIVIPEEKFLYLEITTDKETYRPQDDGELIIKVTDQNGDGVETELSVGIVDESIYALAPDLTPDMRKVFFGKRPNRVTTHSSVYFRFYGYARGTDAGMAGEMDAMAARLGFGDVKADKYKEARVRKDFRDTMFWQAHVRTNSKGLARLRIHFPDNLTTWRITARAISEDTRVGQEVSKRIVRKDLIVRMETPRFFMQGDEVTISTIVHKYLDEAKQTKVSLQGQSVVVEPAGDKILTVPRNGEKRVDWTLYSTEVGTATLVAKALTNEESDAMQTQVPVLPHGLKMSEATVVDIDAEQAVKEKTITIPASADPATAQLYVSVSPSLASSMLSALEDLAGYPYG